MLHTSFTAVAICSGIRSVAGRLAFLRFSTASFAEMYRRKIRL